MVAVNYAGSHHRSPDVLITAVAGLSGESFWNTTLPRLHPSNLRLVNLPPPLASAHHPAAAPPPPVSPAFPWPYTPGPYVDPHRQPTAHTTKPFLPDAAVVRSAPRRHQRRTCCRQPRPHHTQPWVWLRHCTSHLPWWPSRRHRLLHWQACDLGAPLYDAAAAVVAATASTGAALGVVGGATSGGSGSSSSSASRLTPELQAVAASPVPLDYSSQADFGEEYIDVQGTATPGLPGHS
ncbi:hypothetical protein MRX96_015372 [Rhipicephalus microplus]